MMSFIDQLPTDRPVRIVVLTGAGISAESGIPTFRGKNGMWNNQRIVELATPKAWEKNREKVWQFYQQRRKLLLEVQPNSAHIALAKLERILNNTLLLQKQNIFSHQSEWEDFWLSNSNQLFTLITQNVDDLHQRAGSLNVIAMHGQLRYLRCLNCQILLELMADQYLTDKFIECPFCGDRKSILRPHIVWFGETPFGLQAIEHAVLDCDLFLVIGTSGHVYPAAGLLSLANQAGAWSIGINLEPPANTTHLDQFYQGLAGQILPDLVEDWASHLIS